MAEETEDKKHGAATAREAAKQGTPGAWSPFAHAAFTLLWTATLVSNIGTWMHDVGAGWLMTQLNPSPTVVALVQSATTAPIFLFALLAGALADRVDKRRYLLVLNVLLFFVVSVFALMVWAERMTPSLLLIFTFLIGTGAAFMAPAWQSVVPSLIPREKMQAAIALNSLGINVSRAIGPAIAGILITTLGLAAPFVANAASFLVIIAALAFWKPEEKKDETLPPEPLWGSMITGLRHAAFNKPLKASLVRALGFFFCASGYWALLPLVAKGIPGGGATLYGNLMASVGTGAVLGAILLPKIRARLGINTMAGAGTLVTALAMTLLALAANQEVAMVSAALGGFGWIAVLTSMHVSTQTSLPNWVRARGLAIFLMVFFGCMASGSAIWGQVASMLSVKEALLIAAAGLVILLPIVWRFKLGQGTASKLSPAMSWATPQVVADGDDNDRGPVMITLTYQIDPKDEEAFLKAINELAGERYRDGAHRWGVFQDTHDTGRWQEVFFVASWAEHMRQHARATEADQDLHDRVHSFHKGQEPVKVDHYLAPRTPRTGA